MTRSRGITEVSQVDGIFLLTNDKVYPNQVFQLNVDEYLVKYRFSFVASLFHLNRYLLQKVSNLDFRVQTKEMINKLALHSITTFLVIRE